MDLPEARHRPWGVFTVTEAQRAGWTRQRLDTACRRGLLLKLRPGVLVAAAAFADRDARGQHATLVAAEQLVLGSEHLVARRSAAFLLGLPLIGDPPARPQLVTPTTAARTRPHARHVRRALVPIEDRELVVGLPGVSAARVVADIARHERFRNAVVVADAILRAGTPRAELEACLRRMSRWPGVARARQVVAFANGLAESPLESLSRAGIFALGLPAPELQVEVWLGDRLLGRADALWRDRNTVGEADGLGKFGLTDAERDAAFRATKQRQEWFEDVGLEVVRWGWPEAWRPEGVLDTRLQRAFERGRRQVLDPRVRFVPTGIPAAISTAIAAAMPIAIPAGTRAVA